MTTTGEFVFYETDQVGEAAAILTLVDAEDGVPAAIVNVRAEPPKNNGSRPWCTVVIGCGDGDVLQDAVNEYRESVDGPAVPCKEYEDRRKDVMRAISVASERYNGGRG